MLLEDVLNVVPASDTVEIHLLQFGLIATIDGNVMGIEAHIAQLKRDRIIAAIMVICCLEDVLNIVDRLLLLFVATYSLAFRKMIENGEHTRGAVCSGTRRKRVGRP